MKSAHADAVVTAVHMLLALGCAGGALFYVYGIEKNVNMCWHKIEIHG